MSGILYIFIQIKSHLRYKTIKTKKKKLQFLLQYENQKNPMETVRKRKKKKQPQ
jgi:hypothetical protein